MTDKELKRLSRAELLELLLLQTQESERLRTELAQTRQQLEERQLRIQNAGSLAQAVIDINGVMEAAQKAADQYLENIAAMEAEARSRYDRIMLPVRQSTGEAGEETETK